MCDSDHEVQLISDTFPIPEEHGLYPFMDVAAQQSGNKVVLITAAAAIQHDDPLPIFDLKKDENSWVLSANNGRQKLQVNIITQDVYPELSVVM